MIAMAEGPVPSMLTIVIAIPDGLGTLIVPTVSWSMSQRISITLTLFHLLIFEIVFRISDTKKCCPKVQKKLMMKW